MFITFDRIGIQYVPCRPANGVVLGFGNVVALRDVARASERKSAHAFLTRTT
ncbi:predicted protein [Plenodomus lingam JN3]|uniref:Predicted protein n=1 Tax=Leptosphaeria maculans (strain JN3 / isolate v23.1.3 / race Av1-4-5-6-7-8) TaxID=985895 RepID=E4ZHD8_LEPMJ|nr:predicted protein [Plenodomus lingam JN3]CBX90708.1 predicted protein [Plenodomus lingam JN3]